MTNRALTQEQQGDPPRSPRVPLVDTEAEQWVREVTKGQVGIADLVTRLTAYVNGRLVTRPYLNCDAADIVQDAMVDFWSKWALNRPAIITLDQLLASLHVYCRYSLSNAVRRKGVPLLQQLEDGAVDPIHDPWERAVDRDWLKAKMEGCSPRQKVMVELYISGNAPESIAAQLGMSRDNFYHHWSRLVERLSTLYRAENSR